MRQNKDRLILYSLSTRSFHIPIAVSLENRSHSGSAPISYHCDKGSIPAPGICPIVNLIIERRLLKNVTD